MPELNLSGIDLNPLISFDNEDTPKNSSSSNGGLDLSGIDTSNLLFSTKSKTKSSSNRGEVFQPQDSPWNIAGLSSIQEFYKKATGLELPISNKGQGAIHNSWKLDHRNAADIGLDPRSKEGQQLISYLKENNIPFAAFNGSVPGVATSKHIHVGFLSSKTGQKYPIGSTLEGSPNNNQESQQDLNLEGIDTSALLQEDQQTKPDEIKAGVKGEQLNVEGIDTSILINPTTAIDPLKVNFAKADNEEKKYSPETIAARRWTQSNKPIILGKNPYELGNPIVVPYTFVPNARQNRPDLQTATDLWLNAWNPTYKEINDKYRKETGGLNIIDLGNPGNIVNVKGNEWKIQGRPSRSDQADFEAYKQGGIPALIATRTLAKQQWEDTKQDYVSQVKQIQAAQDDHPYLKDLMSLSPATEIMFRGGKDWTENPAYQQEVVSTAMLANNLRYLGKALYTGTVYGYDSQQYIDLIAQEQADKAGLNFAETSVPQQTALGRKVATGILGGAVAIPRFMAAGAIGRSYALPLMVYLENLHKGNREAAMAALPMALMAGIGHGLGEFTSTNSGTSAPFRSVKALEGTPFTKENLSILTEELAKGENLSIKQLTPFQRQLVLRGANALTLAGTSLAINPQQGLTNTIANLTIGSSFPVGESPGEVKLPTSGENVLIPKTNEAATKLGLEPARVNVPLAPTTILGENARDISTTFLPSGEAPENKYKERPSSALTNQNLEKGFVATQEGATVHLGIDTAALNYLELERSLKTGSYRNKGEDLNTDLQKQSDIKAAMDTLKQGIPDETLEFFRQNENAIRSSLQGNYELNQSKSDLLRRKAEGLKPDDVKAVGDVQPNPLANGQETPAQTLGNIGKNNIYTNQEDAHKILANFFNITKGKQGSFGGTLVPYGDVIVKKSADAAYLGAFFIEDFYHRGVKPTVGLVLNKIRTTLGDYGKYITDDQAKVIFQKGMDFYNSNEADPFFSKMKQDATEKLPNRFTVDQARNILSQHKNESEWTIGLEDFLKENEGKKISKQDLIDVIQRGQVRVEASVAQENNPELQRIDAELYTLSQQRLEATHNHNESLAAMITKQISDLNNERNNYTQPKYSLKNTEFQGQGLELPGAKNSKEIKLISVINQDKIEVFKLKFGSQNWVAKDRQTGEILFSHPNEEILRAKVKDSHAGIVNYVDPHFNEIPNVLAHYRSNDRTTTDNIPINFIEEAQSQWNQEGAKQGFRNEITTENFREKGYDIQIDKNAYGEDHPIYLFGKKSELPGNYSDSVSAFAEKSGGIKVPFSEQEAIKYFINNRNIKGMVDSLIEPNPFMGNLWKELIWKRALRDSVIAKDENGNYKYNGLGWTTARQQQKRYNKLLQSTELRVHRVSDAEFRDENGLYEIEAKSTNGTFVNIPNAPTRGTLEEWEPIIGKEYVEKIRQQNFDKVTMSDAEADRYSFLAKKHADSWDNTTQSYTISDIELEELDNLQAKLDQYENSRRIPHKVIKGSELTFGNKGYADYDEAYKNILSRIGKRFGAQYSQKEINLGIDNKLLTKYDILRGADGLYDVVESSNIDNIISPKPFENRDAAYDWLNDNINVFKKENIHFLEITPSMRQSLEKEGLSLYGLGGNEPLKNPETGIRNKITSQDGFDKHRNTLIEALTKDNAAIDPSDGTVFGAGLSPDAFTDITKLTYQDFKDFASFSKELISRFGAAIKPYLQDLWIQTKGLAESIGEGIDSLDSYITQGKDSPYFKARQVKEGGFLGLGLKPKTIGEEARDTDKENRKKIPYFEWYSLWRNVGLAQLSDQYSKIYEPLRSGQRVKNSLGSYVLAQLTEANNIAIVNNNDNIAKTIWIGDQFGIGLGKGKTYTDAELLAGDAALNRPALNTAEIQAYRNVRKSIDAGLYIREVTKLRPMYDRATNLNDQLLAATPGTPAYVDLQNKLLDLAASINSTKVHFQELKDTGYISRQRRGLISAYAEDPNFPIDNPNRILYNQFENSKDAAAWLDEQVNKYGAIVNPDTAIKDVRKPQDLRIAAAKLTPGQFEDLIDSSGVNSKDPEVEKIRAEVYSKYPSYGYELKRDFIRGLDTSWKGVMASVAHQTETYASSWYSRVAGEEARKALETTGLQDSDYNLYQTAQKYIDHEISAPPESYLNKKTMQAKKAVFLFQIGHDINMLWRHGLAQPISQTYSYFSRVENEGQTLSGTEPEKYFISAMELTGRMGKQYLQQLKDPIYVDPKIPQEFQDIYQRLKDERVLTTEFTRDLLEMETDKTVQSQLTQQLTKKNPIQRFFNMKTQEHWAGAFLRGGIKTARTHAAAEAYLIGTEKFGLTDETLTDFIVRAVDATSMNFSRAEAPLIIRSPSNTGYGRKLLYQFEAFNHMWTENLALNVKADFAETYKGIDNNAGIVAAGKNIATDLVVNKAASTIRHLAPLAVMSGIKNLPLAGFVGLLYTLISGKDPKKKFDSVLGNDTLLENIALNGITTNPAIAAKAAPTFPFLDKIKLQDSLKGTLSETLSTSNIPVVSTSTQIAQGISDLIGGQKLRAASELLPFKPLRGLATAERYNKEGVRNRANEVLVPKNKVTEGQKVLQTIGLTPAPLLKKYDAQTTKKIITFRNSPLVRKLRRAL